MRSKWGGNKVGRGIFSVLFALSLTACVKDEDLLQIVPSDEELTENTDFSTGASAKPQNGLSGAQGHPISIKIGIIGDSISTFDGFLPSSVDGYDGATYKAYYPKGNVNKVEKTWWYKTALLLGCSPDDICNCSWSGSYVTGNATSTTSAYAGCSDRRIQDLSVRGFEPDVVLCFISCNDWANSVSIGTWAVKDSIPETANIETLREAYGTMILKIKHYYPSATIFCMTNLEDKKRDYTPGWPSNNRKGISTEAWNSNITELAGQLGCHTVDLNACGINYDNAVKYTVDSGLHPNDAGMTLVAKKVAGAIAEVLKL